MRRATRAITSANQRTEQNEAIPIHRLPDEVLALIFLAGRDIPEHGSRLTTWTSHLYEIQVCSVCRTWRAAGRDCRRLWSPIVIVPPNRGKGEGWFDMVDQLLQLSGSAPLEVFVCIGQGSRKCLTLLRQHLHRVFALSVVLNDVRDLSPLFPLVDIPKLRTLSVQGVRIRQEPLVITGEVCALETLRYHVIGMPLDVTSVPTTSLRNLNIRAALPNEYLDDRLVQVVSRCSLEQLHVFQSSWTFSCFDLRSSSSLTHLSIGFRDLVQSDPNAFIFDSPPLLRHLSIGLGRTNMSVEDNSRRWPSLPLLRSLKITGGAPAVSVAIVQKYPSIIALESKHNADVILKWLGDAEGTGDVPLVDLRLIRMSSDRMSPPSRAAPGLYGRLLERRPSIRIEEYALRDDSHVLESIPDRVQRIFSDKIGYDFDTVLDIPPLCEEADRLMSTHTV